VLGARVGEGCQNSQNRDTKAINIKLDELLRAIEGARNRLVDLKDASDDDLDQLEGEFQRLARQEGSAVESRKSLHASKVPSRRERRTRVGIRKNKNGP
jgi:low affinity Fe/Cu permease